MASRPARAAAQPPRIGRAALPNSKSPAAAASETVDPRWLLSAALGVFLLAAACAYATVCILFARNQWQLVLHPSRVVTATPASVRLRFEEVHFGPGANGQPNLDGWWLPAAPAAPAALLLHDGDVSLDGTLPMLGALHAAGLGVLAFDYRGFGRSAGAHPSQRSMEADTRSALDYLVAIRHKPMDTIVLVGQGLGASLAVTAAAANPLIPAVILESPDGDFGARSRLDTRASLVPFTLLFHENFPLADPLHSLATPKLILTETAGRAPTEVARAADPKMTVELAHPDSAAVAEALRRFLGTYLTQPPSELQPLP